MSDPEFKKIENIKEYLAQKLAEGIIQPAKYVKSAQITARRGTVGEKIVTIMASGLRETENTVTTDEKTGNPDWVVKNPSGEEYIVSDPVFSEKYEPVEGTTDTFRAKGKPITAGQADENICFMASWGEPINLVAGGYLVFSDMDDIYGIQEAEFLETYSPASGKA